MNRVGHAFFKRRMREEDAIFGGEVTGHYYFRDNFYADNGFIPALLILELMSRKEVRHLRELLAPLREKYFISGEINTKVGNMNLVQEKIDGLAATLRERPRLFARRHLRGVPRLALQRPGVEHRADAASEPRGDDGSHDGSEARRGAGVHPRVARGVRAESRP